MIVGDKLGDADEWAAEEVDEELELEVEVTTGSDGAMLAAAGSTSDCVIACNGDCWSDR